MSKKHFTKGLILLLTLGLLIIALSGCSSNNAQEGAPADNEENEGTESKIELKWYQPEPVGHPWTDVGQEICDGVFEKSDGRIKITQYPAGSLGSQAEAVDMLRTGTLDILTSGPSIMASYYEPVQIFSLPYIFDNKEQAYKILDGPIGERIFNDIILSKSNVRTIDHWYFGNRTLTTKGVEATKPEDLNGVKVRCMDTPVAKNVVAALGANPIPVAFSELYMALQTGVVAGQENPLATIYAQKYQEVQDNVILTNHSVHMGTIFASEMNWQQLADEDRNLILEVFKEKRPLIDQKIDEAAEVALEEMKAKGIKVIEPDVEAFKKYADDYVNNAYKNEQEWLNLIAEINEDR